MVVRSPTLWRPEALSGAAITGDSIGDFAYVVLEELIDEHVVLMAWPWPHADAVGHLYWTSEEEEDPRTAAIERRLLHRQLYLANRLRRAPRLGDVYAAAGLGGGWGSVEPVSDVRLLFEEPVYDISADAREAAKLAYQGAVAPVRTPRASDGAEQRLLDRASKRRARLAAKQLHLSPPPRTRRARR